MRENFSPEHAILFTLDVQTVIQKKPFKLNAMIGYVKGDDQIFNCEDELTADNLDALWRQDMQDKRNQQAFKDALRSTDPDEVDMAQLVACAPEKPEVMRKDIEDTIDAFQSEGLKKIVREMLRLTGDKLEWFPAAQRLHHAERSGLLHHTTSMLNLARHVVAAYPFLNAELLYAGVILHDLCKTTEMISDETGSVSDYSADGLLIGHLVRGVARIEEAAKNVGVSGEIVLLLEHMVLSHHSIPEYGSPKAPMFPEAEVLARIDDLDAKMNEMQGILSRVPEGAFSEKVWSLDRRIYHPKYQEIDGAE